MIKKLFFLLIFLITGISANAQVTLGVIGGLNMQSVSGDAPKDASYSGSTGYMIGISGEFRIANGINLVLQPNYNLTGTKIGIDIGEKDPKDSMRVKLNFFRVPLMAKIEAFNGVTYFLSGVDLGFLQNANVQDVNKTTAEKDIKEKLNAIDFAALFGVGVKFKVSKMNLSLEGRYSQSFSNLSKDNQGEAFDNLPSRFRLSGFQLLTYISFNL